MKSLNISQVDSVFANGSYPIEFFFYYKEKFKTNKIRSALKKLFELFWPMFGYYNAGKIYYKRYVEKEYFDEEIIRNDFNTQETSINLYNSFRHVNPTDLKKLFFLKIFHYNNGTVLIPKLNHLAGDGYCYFYFLSFLAALSRNQYIPLRYFLLSYKFKPNHHRTVLRPFSFKDRKTDPLPDIINPVIEYEKISKTFVQDQIKLITRKFKQSVSKNDLLCARIIKRMVKRQRKNFDTNFQLVIPVDVRQRIAQYGSRFFGNALLFHNTSIKNHDVNNTNIKELAVKIRMSMPYITDETYVKYLSYLEDIIDNHTNILRPYDPEEGCLITNLSRLTASKLDFGSGKPEFTFLLTVGKNSAAILANRDHFILRYVY